MEMIGIKSHGNRPHQGRNITFGSPLQGLAVERRVFDWQYCRDAEQEPWQELTDVGQSPRLMALIQTPHLQ